MKYTLLTLLLCIITLTGCAANHPVPSISTTISSDQTTGIIREAKIGDVIYEEGTYDIVNALEMSNSIESSMPGAMFFPFGFSIRKTLLKPKYQTDFHTYYAAPYEDVLASHTMLGSVIVEGDTIGVRIDKKTGQHQWYVDNSQYNSRGMNGNSTTIWYRNVKDTDNVNFKVVEVQEFRSQTPFKRIIFEGAHNNTLLFIYTELSSGSEKEREYRFDIQDQGTTISMKGMTFKVLTTTNTGIEYLWL